MIFYKPHFFKSDTQKIEIQPGKTLLDHIPLLSVPAKHRDYLVVSVDGVNIPVGEWGKTLLHGDETVGVQLLPMGGDDKNPLAFIAQIALLATTGSMVARWGLTGTSAALVNAGLTVGGTLLINSVFPPPTVNRDTRRDPKESQNFTAQAARNKLDPYGPQISVFGKTVLFPKYAAAPFTLSVGDVQYLYMIFDLGYGKVEPTSLKFGERGMLSAYEDLEYKLHQEFESGDSLEFFTDDVYTDPFALEVLQETPRVVTTTERTDEAIVNLTWPRGLVYFNDQGNRGFTSVDFKIEWKKNTDENYSVLADAKAFSVTHDAVVPRDRHSAKYIVSTIRFDPVNGSSLPYDAVRYVGALPQIGDTIVSVYSPVPIDVGVDTFSLWYGTKKYGITKVKSYPNSSRMDITLDASLGENAGARTSGFIYHGTATSISKGTDTIQVISSNYIPVPGDHFVFSQHSKHIIQSVTPIQTMDSGYSIVLESPLEFDIDGGQISQYAAKLGVYASVGECYIQDQDTVGQDFNISRSTAEPFSVGISIKFSTQDQYDIRVTRITGDSASDRTINEFSITSLQSLTYQVPVAPRKPRTYIEMKVKVNEQLNGPIEDFNCIASRLLPVDDGQGNFTLAETSLAPWIIREILTGSIAPKPIATTQIHEQSFRDCETWCKQLNTDGEYKFQCDFVFDWDSTVRDLIQQIAATARASVIQVDGVYQIIIDQPKALRTQVFTSRNVSGYTGGRTITDRPDYVRASFTDREVGYKPQTGNVFDDDKTLANSTTFESQEHFGTVRWRQAWENTRWMMSQGIHRSNFHKFTTDIEGIICLKGDRVGFQHELPKQGGNPARIKSIAQVVVNATRETRITMDRDAVDNGFESYSVLIRESDGTVYVTAGASIEGVQIRMPDIADSAPDPFTDSQPGDLIVYGEPDNTIIDCLVDDIEPLGDLASEITLVNYAPEIQTADSGTLGPYEHRRSNSNLIGAPPKPVISIKAHQSIEYKDRLPFISIWLTWVAATAGTYASQFEIYYQGPEDYESIIDKLPFPLEPKLVSNTLSPRYQFLDSIRQDQVQVFGKSHFFWVIPVSTSGAKYPINKSSMVRVVPKKDDIAPGPVRNLRKSIKQGNLTILWTLPGDIDISYFEVRRADLGTSNWDDSQFLGNIPYPDLKVSDISQMRIDDPVDAAYLVAAVDTTGNRGDVSSIDFQGIIPTILSASARVVDGGVETEIEALPGDFPIVEFRVYSTHVNRILIGKSVSPIMFLPIAGVGNMDVDIEVQNSRGDIVSINQVFDSVEGQEWKRVEDSYLDTVPLVTVNNATEGAVNGRTRTFNMLTDPGKTWDAMFSGGKSFNQLYQEGNGSVAGLGGKADVVLRWLTSGGRAYEGVATVNIDTTNLPPGIGVEAYIIAYESSFIVSGDPAYTVYTHPTKYPLVAAWKDGGIKWYGKFKKAVAFEISVGVKHLGNVVASSFDIDITLEDVIFRTVLISGEIFADENDAEGTNYSIYEEQGVMVSGTWSSMIGVLKPVFTPIEGSGAYVEIPLWDGAGFKVKLFDSQGNRVSGNVSWQVNDVVIG
jgi:hypothetical protein